MVTIRSLSHTLFVRLFLITTFLLLCIPVTIYFLLPSSWRYKSNSFFRLTHFFYSIVIKGTLLSITYKGIENLPNEPAIFAANHQSSFDIPLLGVLARGYPHAWLALSTLMESPILKFILPRVSVLVDTSSPFKSMRSVLQIIDLVKKYNLHIMIFPEGGRFVDGKIHDFFGGFAILARKTNRPVIPVYIQGINKVYPPGAFLMQDYPVTVIIGKAFFIDPNETDAIFKERVYQWFVEQAKEYPL